MSCRLTLPPRPGPLSPTCAQDGAFDEAVKGVDGIAHTASPFHFRVEDPHTDLINPAVKGTKGLLNSALLEPKVQRVVITSSFASIVNPYEPVYSELLRSMACGDCR